MVFICIEKWEKQEKLTLFSISFELKFFRIILSLKLHPAFSNKKNLNISCYRIEMKTILFYFFFVISSVWFIVDFIIVFFFLHKLWHKTWYEVDLHVLASERVFIFSFIFCSFVSSHFVAFKRFRNRFNSPFFSQCVSRETLPTLHVTKWLYVGWALQH